MTLSQRIAQLTGPDRAVDAEAFKEHLLDVLRPIAAIADAADKMAATKDTPHD